jgi:alkylresorcinol/alkylpyrone synthase
MQTQPSNNTQLDNIKMQTQPSNNTQLDNIKTILTELIVDKLKIPQQDIETNKSFHTYGLDSLKSAEILKGIEVKLGLQLSFSFLEQNDSLETLAQSIASKITKQPLSTLKTEEIAKISPSRLQKIFNHLGLVGEQLLHPAMNPPHRRVTLAKPKTKALSLKTKAAAPQVVASCSAFPDAYYSQEQLVKAFHDSLVREEINVDLEEITRFFTNVTIKGRHLALPPENNLENKETLEAGLEVAVDLAEKAILQLLAKTGLDPEDISQVVEVSLIPATPSIFARLISRIPFPPHTKRMSLYGVGCMNGVHGLGKINDYLKGHPSEAVILVSVELASVLWQGSFQKDLQLYLKQFALDPEKYEQLIKMTLVTAALFGDGAMALLVVGPEHPYATAFRQPRIIDCQSNIVPDTVDLIGVDILIRNGCFRAVVKPEVPALLPEAIKQTIEPLLERNKLTKKDISHWILHPGGPKIVQAIEEQFGLHEDALKLSWETLAQVGNLSSAHALYMLNQLLISDKPPRPGEYGLLIAMGPGLSQEAVLLQF